VDGKTIIITGATAGIGEATARLFAESGANVVLAARGEDRGKKLEAELKDQGHNALFVRADMAMDADIKNMVDAAVHEFGGLDFAFNNAGMFGTEAPLHEYDDTDWDAWLAVNLTGVYRCMKYEVAAMLESGAKTERGAVIVNNASTVGHRGTDHSGPAYTTTKHGVIGLTRQTAINYVKQNIRVNAVSPGPTRTEITAPLVSLGEDAVQALADALIPMGRLGRAEEVAKTAFFLCSDGATMITGHDIPIDGGQLARL
jgi:NAD(P)-dependent dehydrogenase (short-subunit alcohol dehydrogenase family)